MYINSCSAVLESANLQKSAAEIANFSPIQFSIDLINADRSMFESVINLDLMEAFNESGTVTLSESDMELALESAAGNILIKIKELLRKAREAISMGVKKAIAKLQDLFSKDKHLVKKYGEAFNKTVSNFGSLSKGGEGSTEYTIINFKAIDELVNTFAGYDKATDTVTKIIGSRGTDDYGKYVEEHKETSSKCIEELKKNMENITEKKSGSNLLAAAGSDYVSKIKAAIEKGKTGSINAIKKFGNISIKTIDTMRSGLEKFKAEDDDAAKNVKIYNAAYSVCSTEQITINKMMSMLIGVSRKEYSLARKQYVQIAKMSKGKAEREKADTSTGEGGEDTANNEAAYENWVLGQLSEMYVEDQFEGFMA